MCLRASVSRRCTKYDAQTFFFILLWCVSLYCAPKTKPTKTCAERLSNVAERVRYLVELKVWSDSVRYLVQLKVRSAPEKCSGATERYSPPAPEHCSGGETGFFNPVLKGKSMHTQSVKGRVCCFHLYCVFFVVFVFVLRSLCFGEK